jgi:hypothetical protein
MHENNTRRCLFVVMRGLCGSSMPGADLTMGIIIKTPQNDQNWRFFKNAFYKKYHSYDPRIGKTRVWYLCNNGNTTCIRESVLPHKKTQIISIFFSEQQQKKQTNQSFRRLLPITSHIFIYFTCSYMFSVSKTPIFTFSAGFYQ